VRLAFALALALATLATVVALSANVARTPVAAAGAAIAPTDPLCFYQNGRPVCVERPGISIPATSSAETPESLLNALLDGPTPEERAQGLESALPPGTRLVAVEPDGRAITIRLAFPAGYLTADRRSLTTDHGLQTTFDALANEAIVEQIVQTLFPLNYRDFYVEVEDPLAPGTFRPLSTYLPPLTIPAKSPNTSNTQYLIPNTRSGQSPFETQAPPQGALDGKTVYVSAGHGWQWNGYGWRTQRPPYPDASTGYAGPIIEDHNNAEVVNQYLLRYLRNAGADVWTARERDLNAWAQVVDDASTDFSASGDWDAVGAQGYSSGYLSATTSLTATAAVTWTTDPLPADGVYALYVWYVSGPDRADDARYTVHHAGGATELSVDQRRHGHTWRYVGRFAVRAGERLTVCLSNRSINADRIVVADAIRLGGGTFDSLTGVTTEAPYPPDEPWWEVAAYYQVQRLGLDLDDFAYFNDVVARPLWARWEHAGSGDDAVYVSWHTNGYNGHNTTTWGSVSFIHSFQAASGSAALRHAIHSELVSDARAGWDPDWRDLGEASRDLGELRELWDQDPGDAIPGVLLEIAYHDHATDTDALKDPRFALLSARAVYQGIVKYYEARDGVDLTLLPEPPTHLTVRNDSTELAEVDGPGRVTVSWRPSPTDSVGLVGDPAESYRVYTSRDGLGWDEGQAALSTSHTLTGLQENELVFVQVTAVNAGGESFPTPVLAARASLDGEAQILLVDGFDRIDRHGLILEDDPTEGINARLFPDQINNYDYVVEHGQVISLPFDSAANEAVASDDLNITQYSIVDWILGEESSEDHTFDAAEQAALATHLANGGALFVSGAEVGWDLATRENGPDFYRTYLGADMAGDDAGTYLVTPTAEGIFAGLGDIEFRDNYDADFPDQLTPGSGSIATLNYLGGAGGVAAIQYDAGGCQRVVYLGFPFETIAAPQRATVMARALDFLGADGCLSAAPQTAITIPINGGAFNSVPDFAGKALGFNAIERVEVQIGDPLGRHWDGQGWVTPSVWLTALGTTAWRYPLPAPLLSGTLPITTLEQGTYRLTACAWDTASISDTTPATSRFIYDTISPTIDGLVWPADGQTVGAAPDRFAWWGPADDGGSALAYQLELDGQRYTTTGVVQGAAGTLGISLIVYTPTTPLALNGGGHTWRVRAFDAAGNYSAWTPPQSFIVESNHVYLPLVCQGGNNAQPEANLLLNGGFETEVGWDLTTTGYDAAYVTAPVHSGQRAGQAQVPAGQAGYSSLAQTVTLPNQQALTLSFWFHPTYDDGDAGDLQYVSLTEENGTSHLLWMARQDDQQWLELELDLSLYHGQTVLLRFGAKNDGDETTATLVVDDVRLEVSGQ
jgi:N-acetylmuramoyl-L-alanine amidase